MCRSDLVLVEIILLRKVGRYNWSGFHRGNDWHSDMKSMKRLKYLLEDTSVDATTVDEVISF